MSVWFSAEYLALGSVAIALIAVAYSMYTTHASRKHVATLVSHIDDLGKELNAISHSALGMGRRLQALGDKNDRLENEIEEIQKNDPVKVSYSEAARLVKMGASVEELMSACGISRPEAELVSALTNQRVNAEKEEVPVLRARG